MAFGFITAHPQRRATIRSRAEAGHVYELVRQYVEEPAPEGLRRAFSHGYVTGGAVGDRDFRMAYHFNSARNPQTYTVVGTIEDRNDWRVVRLTITARSPWLGGWGLAGLVAFAAVAAYSRGISPGAAAATVLVVVVVLAIANVLYIPDAVTERVSHHLASLLHGSVLERGEWVVPRGE